MHVKELKIDDQGYVERMCGTQRLDRHAVKAMIKTVAKHVWTSVRKTARRMMVAFAEQACRTNAKDEEKVTSMLFV